MVLVGWAVLVVQGESFLWSSGDGWSAWSWGGPGETGGPSGPLVPDRSGGHGRSPWSWRDGRASWTCFPSLSWGLGGLCGGDFMGGFQGAAASSSDQDKYEQVL